MGNRNVLTVSIFLITAMEMIIKSSFEYLTVRIKDSDQETVKSRYEVYKIQTCFHVKINFTQIFKGFAFRLLNY